MFFCGRCNLNILLCIFTIFPAECHLHRRCCHASQSSICCSISSAIMCCKVLLNAKCFACFVNGLSSAFKASFKASLEALSDVLFLCAIRSSILFRRISLTVFGVSMYSGSGNGYSKKGWKNTVLFYSHMYFSNS